MPSTEPSGERPRAPVRTWGASLSTRWIIAFLLLASMPLIAQEKRLSIYAPQMFYQVSVTDHGKDAYVGLFDILEPLGHVESRVDGKKWKLSFTGSGSAIDAEFQDGKRKGRVRGTDFELPANFVLQGDRGYVPIASLANLLPRLLEKTAEVHPSPRRLFIGGVAMKFTLDLKHNPNRLVATLPNSVSPQIATDGTHVRLTFVRDPVIPTGIDVYSYTEPPFASSNFSEANGIATLDVVGTVPLQAAMSDGGKTLTISAMVQQAAPSTTPANQQPATPTPAPGTPASATSAAPAPAKPRTGGRMYYVALDAGHGGDERGAQLTETLNEKDVTLALARRIQHELEARGITVYNVRSGDNTLTADQRAASANGSRAAIYVSVHAATLGTGLRVFTAMVPPMATPNRRAFLPWDTAQASFVVNSSGVASSIVTECTSRKISVKSLAAPVRPLNNIAAAAIAVEIAPKADTVESITDAKYQQDIAAAIASGIANVRGKLEVQ
jgi:N-acetylmuramoyl-L-alanine amidase